MTQAKAAAVSIDRAVFVPIGPSTSAYICELNLSSNQGNTTSLMLIPS